MTLLEKLRKDIGWTQAQLGGRIHKSQAHISQWENVDRLIPMPLSAKDELYHVFLLEHPNNQLILYLIEEKVSLQYDWVELAAKMGLAA